MGLRIGAAVTAFFVSFGVSTAWAQAPGSEFKDCDKCLEMVVVPAGSFTMGSPASENGRSDNAKERAAMGLPGSPASENGRSDNEGPQHTVKIAAPFAVGKFHVTVDQFAAFVADTGYDSGSKCWTFEDGKGEEREGR
ncbi:MAG: SUMF1/EgtB/PvdO family nonheme iron enzyme, partial [Hyphomicrobiales bacterium]|nr:SUMF1/EgtB/PvdO family nonheme iron enzyme [Hyphomicrobiales bacterium]